MLQWKILVVHSHTKGGKKDLHLHEKSGIALNKFLHLTLYLFGPNFNQPVYVCILIVYNMYKP